MTRVLLIALATLSAAGCSDRTATPTTGEAAAAADGAKAGRLRAAQLNATIDATVAPAAPVEPDSAEFKELDWLDLLPADELASLERGMPISHAGQRRAEQHGSFSTVERILGQDVKLPGYIVPLGTDDRGWLTEFFFVPYFGACLHAPPPPPNQIVYVSLAAPIRSPEMWEPQWLGGRLRAATTKNALGGSAYVMDAASLAPYDG